MKNALERIRDEPRSMSEGFLAYRKYCSTNVYGFLLESGGFVFDTEKGFLHEYGIWVKPLGDRGFKLDLVNVSDNFDAMIERALFHANRE
jgi:hypothetical protein